VKRILTPFRPWPNKPRQNIGVKFSSQPLVQILPGDASHGCVVGAQFQGRNQQFDTVAPAHFSQLLPKQSVRRHASSNTQSIAVQFFKCKAAFEDQHVNNRLLERSGKVRNHFGRRFSQLVWSG